jgi:prepilin-type N-terminal cleavage/methylation domain-containing protein
MPPQRTRSRARRGLTLLELVCSIAVLTLGISGLARVTLGLQRAGSASRETELATQAARAMLERIQAESFAQAFRSFNATGADDPGGVNTAPGASFAVAGLRALPNDADGQPGEIVFPTVAAQPGVLSENVNDARLGMPQDLDGNGAVDTLNHATDYQILPVLVRVRWQSRDGSSGTVELQTILANY